MDLNESLEKVRIHRSSQIPSQVRQAQLLDAVEGMLKEESAETPTPTAYFAALLSLLDRAEAASSAVSLLAYVVPHVPKPLLVQKIDVSVAKLLPLLLNAETDTAVVRSTIGVLEAMLVNVDASAWQVPSDQLGAIRVFTGVLGLAQDSRPKIRKRAVEAVQTVLKDGKVSRQACSLAFEAALGACEQADDKQRHHGLQLLKAVLSSIPLALPAAHVERLVTTLLAFTKSSDSTLVLASLSAFDALFSSEHQSTASKSCLIALLELAPSPADKKLTPAWLAAIAQSFSSVDVENSLNAFKHVSRYLECPPAAQEVAESAGQCLIAFIANKIPEILESNESKVLAGIAETYLLPLLQVEFHASWDIVCEVCAAFIACLPRELAPALPGVLNIVKIVGALRGSQQLELDQGADNVLAAAIKVLGPRIVCEKLVPLQLDPRSAKGRVWLLPLLADNVENTELEYFFGVLVPLGNEFVAAVQETTAAHRVKLLETVAFQIYALFTKFCDECVDAETAFTTERLELVLTWLYQAPDLRAPVCQGFKLLVTTSESGKEFGAKHGSDILRALLNTYQSMSVDNRAFVLEAVDAILSVLPTAEVTTLFTQLGAILEQAEDDKRHALMDIANVLIPYTDQSVSVPVLLAITARFGVLDDASMQKKVYRAITQINDPLPFLNELKGLLIELQPTAMPNARKTRLTAIELVVSSIPATSDFSFVFHVLPEAILATKDMNEKTRAAAFDLLVLCGQRMKETSGFVDHANIPAIPDNAKTAASIAEFFEMVMAGLTASTPHMVAATATALSRVLYEFHTDLPQDKIEEYVDIVWMLLESQNREIVAATLGFVKVSILVIPQEMLKLRLQPLLQKLLAWSNEHRNHFKNKVRHMIERIIRRCGPEIVEQAFPEQDKKLLQYILKNKERARRKKKLDTLPEAPQPRSRKFDNEFDEALYGSSSEDENENDDKDEPESRTRQPRHKSAQFIINTDDPLDLLDSSALKNVAFNKPGAKRERALHTLPERKGKLVIGGDKEMETDAKDAMAAYMEAVKAGPVRTQSGKLKYLRGKRAPREVESDDELEDHDKSTLKPKVRGNVSKRETKFKKHMKGRRNL